MNFSRNRSRGFTLIELMIVVALIGILLAIATPAYRDQVRKSRRATAKADVLEMVQRIERFHTVNNTFVGYPADVVPSPNDGGQIWYELEPSNLTGTTFLITATPLSDQLNDVCGVLTINHAGVRTEGGATTEVKDCW